MDGRQVGEELFGGFDEGVEALGDRSGGYGHIPSLRSLDREAVNRRR